MSIVNRYPSKIKLYTDNTEQATCENLVKSLNVIQFYLSNFELDTQDPNLKVLVNDVRECIEIGTQCINRLRDVNTKLAQENRSLVSHVGNIEFVRINTEPTESAMKSVMLNADEFYKFVSNHIDYLTSGIKTKIISEALQEFRIKVAEKINDLNQQKQQLLNSTDEENDQKTAQQVAQIDVRIDQLKRGLDAETYEKRLNMICVELKKTKEDAYDLLYKIRDVNRAALDKISAIKQVVNN